jgi:ABC-type dipeptide/oligopeptide/nickel transport system ATPase component
MIKIADLRMSFPVENGSLDVLSGVNMTIADGENITALDGNSLADIRRAN